MKVRTMVKNKEMKYIFLISILLFFVVYTTFSVLAAESGQPEIKFDQIKTLYREDLTEEFGEDLAIQMKVVMGSMADMFKMKVWIYEVKEDNGGERELKEFVDNLLESHPWPANVTKMPVQEDDFGYAITRLIDSYEDELNEAWGSGWSTRAKQAAVKYEDRELLTKSYVYSDPATNITFSISVNSPFGSIRTFKLYEGVYIIITQMSIQF